MTKKRDSTTKLLDDIIEANSAIMKDRAAHESHGGFEENGSRNSRLASVAIEAQERIVVIALQGLAKRGQARPGIAWQGAVWYGNARQGSRS